MNYVVTASLRGGLWAGDEIELENEDGWPDSLIYMCWQVCSLEIGYGVNGGGA